ncbi:TRAP transporter small permease [Sedimentibacter hydroxybenzoicus DSM 7310]|uniref:TRAP transporter small permease n=1 Tax=Sedimentibacter hydroxybenzoicus DSM 7310 TaxID=1123245 RepID=A0A974GX36_SEDHY|nr:TRAP transporter small permease [Sedimentibacter hydroxybenzoicus]NYB74680.1 TRAP transporter small permease [Sedimentibacter hydroxybenzoicus DSM 7310]
MKVLKWLDDNIEKYIIIIITSAMTILLFLSIVFRFLLHLPLAWTEEISLYGLVWLCYFGASLAIKNNSHLKMEIITTYLNKKWKKVFDILSDILFFIFAAFIMFYVTKLTIDVGQRGAVSAVLHTPKWIPYLGVPVAFLLMIIRLIQNIIKSIKEINDMNKELK